jgi:hypothetical protein
MRDGKEIAAHGLKARPKKRNGSCIVFVMTEAGVTPGSFAGVPIEMAPEILRKTTFAEPAFRHDRASLYDRG